MNVKLSRRRRPELETLESVTLLSTLGPAPAVHAPAVHAPVVHVEATRKPTPPAAPPVVALHGTIHTTGKLTGPSTVSVSGSGNLGSVGTASVKLTANLASPPSSVTLSARKGRLILAESTPLLISGNGGSTTYTIVGGTGSYAHATGSGTVSALYSIAKGNKVTLNLRFA